MRSCPGCAFLIADDQEICDFCSSDPEYPAKLKGSGTRTVVGALADEPSSPASTVGLLERPVPRGVNWAETQPEPSSGAPRTGRRRGRESGAVDHDELRKPFSPTPLILVAVVAALGVLGASLAGWGPLAGPLSSLGIGRSQPAVLPGDWQNAVGMTGSYSVDLPASKNVVFEPLDPNGGSAGGLAGLRVDGGDGAHMFAGSTDLGMGSDAIRAAESEEGVSMLAAKYAALRVPGVRTVDRTVSLPYGFASDSVYISEGPDGSTVETRLRVVLTTDGWIHPLETSGPDWAARDLDAAHQRMIGSFVPKR